MDKYTISYSRKEKLAQEESMLDINVEKTKVIESFNGVTLKQSLKELDEFVSDGTIRDWIISHPLMIIPVALIFMLLTDIAIVLLIVIIVSVVTHQQPNLAMGGALFLLLLLPSIIISFSICDEIFVRPNRFDRLKEKTLGTGYDILKDVVDCPIEFKRELYYKLETGYLFLSYNQNNRTLRYFKEDGTEKYINEKLKCYEDFVYQTKPYKYFVAQLENDKMYKISDILTDKAFKGEKNGN